jgi:hypothetical protein
MNVLSFIPNKEERQDARTRGRRPIEAIDQEDLPE